MLISPVVIMLCTPPAIALPRHLAPTLQTDLTPQDLQVIEQLVTIAAYAELATALLSANTQLHLEISLPATSIGLTTPAVRDILQTTTEAD